MKRLFPAAPVTSFASVTSAQGLAERVASPLQGFAQTEVGQGPTRVGVQRLRSRGQGGREDVLAAGEVLNRSSRLLKGDAERTLRGDVPPGRPGLVDAGGGGGMVDEDGRGDQRDDTGGRGRNGR